MPRKIKKQKLNISYYQSLPFRESMIRSIDYRKKGRGYYHKVGDYYPWKIIDRVCEKFIGQSFDKAFSYYCSIVPKYQQHIFQNKFDITLRWYQKGRGFYGWYKDVNGNIQHKRYIRDKKVLFRSIDFESENIYEPLPKHKRNFRTQHGKYLGYKVVKGFELEFSSRYDHRFIQLSAEKRDKLRKRARAEKKYKKEKRYIFKTDRELWEDMDKLNNSITIERLGFNETESFRGEVYHGQQRKKKSKPTNNASSKKV